MANFMFEIQAKGNINVNLNTRNLMITNGESSVSMSGDWDQAINDGMGILFSGVTTLMEKFPTTAREMVDVKNTNRTNAFNLHIKECEFNDERNHRQDLRREEIANKRQARWERGERIRAELRNTSENKEV